jgi:hypothetical protein
MPKNLTATAAAPDITNDKALTFFDRLDSLRAANADAHYNAALLARVQFENRLVFAISSRVNQVLDAITAD